MKKIILFLSLILSPIAGYCGGRNYTIYADTGPFTASTTTVFTTAGAGYYTCLTDYNFISTMACTVRILDGGVTTYILTLPANTGLIKDWSVDDAFCGSAATNMTLSFSTTPVQLNYKGFIRR